VIGYTTLFSLTILGARDDGTLINVQARRPTMHRKDYP
jgi:hypothetical protein